MSADSPPLGLNFSERLRFWRVSQHLTQAEAARVLDIDRAYLSQVERGRGPGQALRTRFLLIERSASMKIHSPLTIAYGLRNLPLLSWAQAGQLIEPAATPSEWDEVVPSDVTDELAFAVRLRGDAMEPRFFDGDIAVLLPGAAAVNGEVVLANLRDEGVHCRILHVQMDPSVLTLSSYNPAHLPLERRRDRFHWIFPVAAIIRRLRSA